MRQDLECDQVARYQRFLLGSRPAFELRLALAGGGEIGVGFDPEDRVRRIQAGGLAAVAGGVFLQALWQVGRSPNVRVAGTKAENVDDWEVAGQGG